MKPTGKKRIRPKHILNEYAFDLGNSTDGPIGMTARVKAKSKRAAAKVLSMSLPERARIFVNQEQVIEIHVWFGHDNIKPGDARDTGKHWHP